VKRQFPIFLTAAVLPIDEAAPASDWLDARLAEKLKEIEAARAKLKAGTTPRDLLRDISPGLRALVLPERSRPPRELHDRPPPEVSRDDLLGFVKRHLPEAAKRIEESERAGRRILPRLRPRLMPLIEAERAKAPSFPDRVEELRAQLRLLEALTQYNERKAKAQEDPASVEAARASLRARVREHQEARFKVQEADAVAIEARTKASRERIAQHREQAEVRVEAIMQRFEQGEGYTDPLAPPPPRPREGGRREPPR
jgi:hypothetical protein